MVDPVIDKDNLGRLSDGDLFKACKRYGVNPGPVTATTRSIYEKRLRKALESQPTYVMTTTKSIQAQPDTSVLDQTQLEHQREAESLAKVKLEQTRLKKIAAERELELQQELEARREMERQRELDLERQKALERDREREREREALAIREREKAIERDREREALAIREREKALEREREQRAKAIEQRERERERIAERERFEREQRIERERMEREQRMERERIERERLERERAERERLDRERLEREREFQRMRTESAAAKARQQSNAMSGGSAIPVRVGGGAPETLNKENLLYPSLNHLDRPSLGVGVGAGGGTTAASRYQFKQPFSDATSGYGHQNSGGVTATAAGRRALGGTGGTKGTKNGAASSGITGCEFEEDLTYPQANSTMMKDALRMGLSARSIDVAKILGEPKGRSSICPPHVASTTTNATVGIVGMVTGASAAAPLSNPTLASVSAASNQSGISPIRDKWAERLSHHGIIRDTNNTLYTSTLTSPTGIRGRQPIHTDGNGKPTLTSSGSVSSTSSNDLYSRQPDFEGKKLSSVSSTGSSENNKTGLFNFNYTYAILCLIATIVVYLLFMHLQPNPPNPIDI